MAQGQPNTPADTWPPKPANYAESQICQAMRGNPISYESCTGLNTAPQRNFRCEGCPVTWRICKACILQHSTAPGIRTINATTGLCTFHTANGTDAIEKAKEKPRAELYRLAPAPRAPILESEPQKPATEKAPETAPEAAAPVATTSPAPLPDGRFDRARIEKSGLLIRRYATGRDRVILLEIVAGSSNKKIAQDKNLSLGSVNQKVSKFYTEFEIPRISGLMRYGKDERLFLAAAAKWAYGLS